MSIPPAKLGWAAAVIDIKGHVIRKNNKTRVTPQIVLMVESKDVHIVRELARLTGSKAEPHNRETKDWMRRGCSEHCPEAHIHVYDNKNGYKWQMPPMMRWTITGVGAAIVLHNIIPYMASDHGYPELVNEIIANSALVGQGSGATRATIRRLVYMGWDLPPALIKQISRQEKTGRVLAPVRKPA